jgi:hypothetical protein
MKTVFAKSLITKVLLLNLFTAMLISTIAQANDTHSQHNLMGSHGMVLIYHPEEGFFASHLPLYRAPHNYQLIYRVQFAESEKLISLINNEIITLLPENFDLRRLIAGERLTIKTQFFQGHFERGGKSQFTTEMVFERPILIEQVSPNFTSEDSVTYLAPISEKHAVFAHKIQKPPSFDAIGFSKNTKSAKKIEVVICDKPSTLNAQTVKAKLEACAQFDVKYIETQDFK